VDPIPTNRAVSLRLDWKGEAAMKRRFILLAAICLFVCMTAPAQAASAGLTFASQELRLPAAGLMICVPADMDTLEGVEVAYVLGLRFYWYSDTFSFTVWVHDSRDMNLEDYAAFYAGRNDLTATAAEINGYAVQRLTNAGVPDVLTVLVAAVGSDTPLAVYALSFSCEQEDDWKLADEILGTLTEY
jgi:hypothetical protein